MHLPPARTHNYAGPNHTTCVPIDSPRPSSRHASALDASKLATPASSIIGEQNNPRVNTLRSSSLSLDFLLDAIARAPSRSLSSTAGELELAPTQGYHTDRMETQSPPRDRGLTSGQLVGGVATKHVYAEYGIIHADKHNQYRQTTCSHKHLPACGICLG